MVKVLALTSCRTFCCGFESHSWRSTFFLQFPLANTKLWFLRSKDLVKVWQWAKKKKKLPAEVGFEPTPKLSQTSARIHSATEPTCKRDFQYPRVAYTPTCNPYYSSYLYLTSLGNDPVKPCLKRPCSVLCHS